MDEEPTRRKLRVLIVDDNEAVRTALVRMLAKMNDLELLGAADSGELALDFALEHDAEVVVMDVSMPGIGGIEATRRLYPGAASSATRRWTERMPCAPRAPQTSFRRAIRRRDSSGQSGQVAGDCPLARSDVR